MNVPRRRFFSMLAMVAGLSAVRASAAPKKNTKNQKRPLTKHGHAAELPKVVWVRGNRFKVGKKTYELSMFAEVIVDGEEAEIDDLQPGMQAMVTGGVKDYGETEEDTLYKATRVVARRDNELEKKAVAEDKKLREKLNKANQKNNRKK